VQSFVRSLGARALGLCGRIGLGLELEVTEAKGYWDEEHTLKIEASVP